MHNVYISSGLLSESKNFVNVIRNEAEHILSVNIIDINRGGVFLPFLENEKLKISKVELNTNVHRVKLYVSTCVY